MGRLAAVLAVPAVVDHQHPAAVRRGRRISQQQLQPARIDPLRVPPRFGEEELQLPHRRELRPRHRLGPASVVSALFRSRGAGSPARYTPA